MKKNKSKFLTLLLTAAVFAAAGGAAVLSNTPAFADTDNPVTYSPSRIFTAENSATVGADSETKTDMTFVLRSQGSVSFKRDLALKWFTDDTESGKAEAKYLSMTFAFKDTDFSKINLTFETAPATALKDKKATNKLVFKKSEDVLLVSVNDGEETAEFSLTDEFELRLAESDGAEEAGEGEFFVFINDIKVGVFENIGANFAEYFSASATTPMVPFAFTAEFPEGATDASATVIFKELNGQDFTLDDGLIKDTAVPVLVVNDEVVSFMLGMPFSLDYEVIDVLDTSVTKTMKYYQYNPTDESAEYDTLTTSTYFFDTVYTVGEGENAKTYSVYEQEGMEFVSVEFTLADDTHTDDDAKKYYLAWYAVDSVKPTSPTHDEELEYIRLDRNENGPVYEGIENVEENGVIVTRRTAEGEALFEAYQDKVTEAAEGVYAGSNSYVYLPSLRGLVKDDDTGYKSLKFSIYYKTESSDSASSSTSLTYDNLRIAVETAGMYEFKILATDKVGNSMYYYVDGYKTKVTSDTIWDIDAIPSFTFSVSNNGLSIEDDDNTVETGYIDVTYSVSDFTVTGVGTPTSEWALYFFDKVAFSNKYSFSTDDLVSVSFEYLKDLAAEDDSADKADRLKEDPIGYFVELYIKALAEHLGITLTAEDLLTADSDGNVILRKIEEFDSTIDEDDHAAEWAASDNKYYWYPSSRSFKPQEAGVYLAFAVYTDSELFGEKVCAYKAINVEADRDIIPGETEWLKNNIASVILFSIAGVLLIIIIILWFVKPSDESIEDVDEEADGKKAKKGKKEKSGKAKKTAAKLKDLDEKDK